MNRGLDHMLKNRPKSKVNYLGIHTKIEKQFYLKKNKVLTIKVKDTS